jgi:ABC-type transporter Mla subunit MlaD
VGVAHALLDSAGARAQRAERRADSLAGVYRTDTVRLWRTLRTLDTLTQTVDRWKHDTVRVVEFVAQAAEAAARCTETVQTCEQRLATANDLTAAVRDSVRALLELERRPWTAAGLAWDPHAQRVGAFVDRDWARLRAGLSVTPDDRSLRLGVRLGWRW